ncbi:MAG: archease [Geobacteraceae bacterium]|nr:archease [Geobacteraceae bacterium]NTW80416.1 archease [Geobacteraceae bacterium]
MPYRFQDEISTADIAFEAWGETREELFISCAAALLRTMAEAPDQVERRQLLAIRLEQEELDMLLFSFLQELIFYKDARRLLLHADKVHIEQRKDAFTLEASVSGEQIDAGRHRLLVDVKAVTLHRFQVEFGENLWKASVVLDV